MRRARLLFALACAVCAACKPEHSGPPCRPEAGFDRSKVIKVLNANRPAVIHNDLPLSKLAEMSPLIGSEKGKLQGLTSVDHSMAVRFRPGIEGESPACVWFEQLTVDVTPAAVDILVPSEYPPGSCEYEAVLAHEREHEAVHRELLEKTAIEVRGVLDRFADLPTRGKPAMAATRKGVEAELSTMISHEIEPAFERFKAELAERQAALDAPGTYAWVRKRCTGWK
jgi:hypothetical protein